MQQPGPGPGAFSLRRCARPWHLLALRSAHGARFRTAAACGLAAGSTALLAGAVPGSLHGPGEGPAPQRARGTGPIEFGHPRRRATDIILVLNAVCMMLQWLSRGALTFWGAKINEYIIAGQWWRLITPAFLHSGLGHLLLNSYALNSVGPELELIGGPRRFLSVYLVSAVTGTLASFVFTPSPSLGSSGSVFGIAAALALFYWRHQDTLGKTSDRVLKQLGITAAINIAVALFVPNIDNWGHLGGMIGGAAVAWLLGPHMQRDGRGRFVDQPPLRWLAYPEGFVFSTGATRPSTSGRAAAQGPGEEGATGGRGGAEAEEGGEGKGKRRHRRRHKPSKRGAEQAPPEEGPDQTPG